MLFDNEYYSKNNSHHSILINDNFELSRKGIDFTNDFNTLIEFKESFGNKRIRINIKTNDMVSDYIAINILNKFFYVIRTKDLTELHFTTFICHKTGKTKLQCRKESNVLLKKSIFSTIIFAEFKKYLENLR